MMRIAIPRYGDRISPRFDCAPVVEIIEWERDAIRDRTEETAPPDNGAVSWAAYLIRRQVEVLLCGGIRRCDYYELCAGGVRVIAGLAGPSEALLAAFCQGRLEAAPPWQDAGTEPGFGNRGRRGGRNMPRGDGTGPQGKGPGTGRGTGPCGQGRGKGACAGRGRGAGQGGRRGKGGQASGGAGPVKTNGPRGRDD